MVARGYGWEYIVVSVGTGVYPWGVSVGSGVYEIHLVHTWKTWKAKMLYLTYNNVSR